MRKILVIEDELQLRMGVSEILKFEGFEVFEAENGATGIVAAQRHQPDLILCDIMMPEKDGYQVLSEIRNAEKTRLIPFIFMTALSERSDQRTGMELGSDDYITKPYTRMELLNAVNTRLQKASEFKAKRESSLNELRENIIRHLPHELRTPLNGMIGYGQLLMDYPESVTREELPHMGKNIYDSAMRLYRLIQNYLAYAQLEVRKGEDLEVHELKSLDKICREVAEEVAGSYNRKEDLKFNTNDGVAYIGNSEFLKIMEELTDNAFKFSNPGDPVLIACNMENQKFCLTVKDAGRGIQATDIPRIGAYMQFNREFHEQQGSGLGLIITKKLVEMYSGELKIESIPGEGTTILVTLPGK